MHQVWPCADWTSVQWVRVLQLVIGPFSEVEFVIPHKRRRFVILLGCSISANFFIDVLLEQKVCEYLPVDRLSSFSQVKSYFAH